MDPASGSSDSEEEQRASFLGSNKSYEKRRHEDDEESESTDPDHDPKYIKYNEESATFKDSSFVGFNQSYEKSSHDDEESESTDVDHDTKSQKYSEESSTFKESNYLSSNKLYRKRSHDDDNNDDEPESTDLDLASKRTRSSFLDSNQLLYGKRSHDENNEDDDDDDDDDNDDESESTDYGKRIKSNIGMGMMKKMGWAQGKGLGREEQGRVEPVEAFKQKGRRGLGHDNTQLSQAILKWDPKEEVVSIQEEIIWLSNSHEPPTLDEIKDWIVLGPKKKTIDNETLFCDGNIFNQVNSSKSIFDTLDKHEMRRARTRSNPYETIRGHCFLNRAAVKMANMDKVCDFMFTQPPNLGNELLYFADVCAGPGGFSEYVLHRKNWHAKGFGFTLRNDNDFKLEDFWAGPPETFHPYYGPGGDGDVYNSENQDAFRSMIMNHTRGLGVHFMMADGGFSVEGDENMQEILSKQLYLCQCLVALMIVREGGHFVTKLFDIFTNFSAGLVYIMSRCFKKISIFKPNTSRPANSERYLICQGKLPNVDNVIQYLSRVNHLISKNDEKKDVIELVPLDIIENDKNFFEYLYESNTTLGRQQVVGLLKIAAFCEDISLVEPRQPEIRKECLDYWGLEDTPRKAPKNSSPDEKLQSMLLGKSTNFLKTQGKLLSLINYKDTVLNTAYDWFFVPSVGGQTFDADKTPTFYLGLGRGRVFHFIKNSWTRVTDIELPAGTLVYGEVVQEHRGEHRSQRKVFALHIIDAYFLGPQDISSLPLIERHALISKFCDALWKPECQALHRVRAKDLHTLYDGDIRKKLVLKKCTLKNGAKALGHYPHESTTVKNRYDSDEEFFYMPNSVLFLKNTATPWHKHRSRTTHCIYYYNRLTKQTEYEINRPADGCAQFTETFDTRMIWDFPHDDQLSINVIHDSLVERLCP